MCSEYIVFRKAGMDMAYKRWIAYFDLFDNELKRGNAGFVKWEQYDECHILSVFINGLTGNKKQEVDVYLDGLYSIGKLNVKNGKAEGTYLLTRGEKNWKEIVRAIWIPLENGKELRAEFQPYELTNIRKEKEKQEIEERLALQEKEKQETEKRPILQEKEKQGLEERPVLQEKEKQEEAEAPVVKEEEKQDILVKEVQINEPVMEMQTAPDGGAGLAEGRTQCNEKEKIKTIWEQLEESRDLTYPFGNNVGCYRIFPKDIAMLNAAYQGLGNNQFLLHGYYNYRHVIICKKENCEDEFCLGVPGIYHEREKMAARMFGFEKFEGTKPKYKTGDLGYYLITVR